MSWYGCTLWLHGSLHLEFFRDRVHELLNFPDISADLVDHLGLPVSLLLGELKCTKVLLAHLLGRILIVCRFLRLYRDTLKLKLKMFDLASLFLRVAFFALGHGLKLPHFVIQVFDAPE